MMKRIVTFIFMVIMLISLSVPCFAESTQHDVYAKYVERDPLYRRSPVKNGVATVTLSDGTIISVSNIQSDMYILYVKEITDADEEAMNWFSQCLQGKANAIYPFDICLLDEDERVILTYDIDLQISSSISNVNGLYFLDANSNLSKPYYNAKNGIVSFKSRLDAYCVLTSDVRQPSNDHQPLSPQTGDDSHIYLWFTIAGFSLLVILLRFWIQKQKNLHK